ncbi:MAG: UbiA family prenyltransferase [bacterium]|nr:UbiA family prenyltransferase [bacterium]
MNLLEKIKLFWDFTRPFTLVAPALGFFSGGITAIGARAHLGNRNFFQEVNWVSDFHFILLGSLMAATLNAASNVLNQVYDLPIDKFNKPTRPLCTGIISINSAKLYAAVLYALALWLGWLVAPQGRRECFWLVFIAAGFTYIYSVPPFRTKRLGMIANITIAIPRGVMLKVAGWSAGLTIFLAEPWYIGLIFGLFLLGATTTKDFADLAGDKKYGCNTLPVKYGIAKSAKLISPFFIIPWLLMPIGAVTGVLTGNKMALIILGIILTFWGIYVDYLMLRKPEELATDANHISWKHMYLMMFIAQIGFAVSYII